MTDHDLLQRFARENSQAAFAELVARHVNLVYSAARRQVRAPQLAEDITQSVFLDLARHARDLSSAQPLAAWLHVVTRRTAIDTVRRESRRQAREQTAVELAAMSTPSASWSQLEPILDEAVAALPDADRHAILLRFFENKSLREIGESLGTSDDAAQKRVSRALDQLRTLLARRGLTVTAATLATDLSAHAILTAPVALTAAIATSTAALSVATAVTSTAVKTVLMTTLQKSLVTSVLVLTAGAGLYEANALYRQRSEFAQLESRSATLLARLARTRDEHTATVRHLAAIEAQIDARLSAARPPATGSDPALEARMKAWFATIDRLKNLFEERPHLHIPELGLLGDDAWFTIAGSWTLHSEDNIRQALAKLRHAAENMLAYKISRALRAYLKASGDALPDQVDQLLPFFTPPIEPTLLARYEMRHRGKLSEVPSSEQANLLSAKAPADVEYDAYWRIGAGGVSNQNAMVHNLNHAQRTYASAHAGQRATTTAQLQSYLKWPVNEAALQKLIDRAPTGKRP